MRQHLEKNDETIKGKKGTEEQFSKAIVFVLIGNFTWFFAYIYPNENQINPYETCLVRGFGMLFLGFIYSKIHNFSTTFQDPVQFRKILLRNFIMLIFGWGVAFSQFYLSLPIVHTICGSGPLFIFLFDYYFNGIKINLKQFVGILLGIIGLIFTVNGRMLIIYFDQSFENKSDFENYRTSDPLTILLVSLILIVSNILWAYSMLLAKKLVFHPMEIGYHLGIVMMLSSGLMCCMNGPTNLTPTKLTISVFTTGLPTTITVFLHISALKMVKQTGVLFILNFSMVIMGYLMSIFYYHENQNPICSMGIFLIIFGVSKAIYFKSKD